MDSTLSVTFAFAGVVITLAAAALGYRFSGTLLRRNTYTQETAFKLLQQAQVEGWNAFRRLSPGWAPILKNMNLEGVLLPEVDLSRADLSGANFRRSFLDGADFSQAVVSGVDFSGASLKGV